VRIKDGERFRANLAQHFSSNVSLTDV